MLIMHTFAISECALTCFSTPIIVKEHYTNLWSSMKIRSQSSTDCFETTALDTSISHFVRQIVHLSKLHINDNMHLFTSVKHGFHIYFKVTLSVTTVK